MKMSGWTWALAAGVAVSVAVGAAVVWGGDDDEERGPEPTTSSSTSTTTTTPPSTASSTTTTSEQTALPAGVTAVTARSGGGSGEVVVDWDAAEGATGYKVLRSSTPDGTFTVVADVDVTTGVATADPQVVNILSTTRSYIPSDGPITAPDPAPRFQYVETGPPGQRCFRVVAYNQGGDGPSSDVVCGSPP